MNIKKKLNIPFILTLLIIATACIVFGLFHFRTQSIEIETANVEETLKEEALKNKIQIQKKFNALVDSLQYLATTLDEDFLDHSLTQIRLKSVKNLSTFNAVAVADTKGNVVDSSGEKKLNVSKREYFQKSIKGEVCISEIIDSSLLDGKTIQVISVPISHQDKIIGIAFGIFDIQSLSKNIDSMQVGNSYSQIVDSNGKYITITEEKNEIRHSNNLWDDLKSYQFIENSSQNIKEDMKKEQSGYLSFRYNKESRISYYTPLGINDWYIFSTLDYQVLNQHISSINNLTYILFIFIGIGFALILGIIIYLSRQSKQALLQVHQKTKYNEELLKITIAESKITVFEYNQKTNQIQFKGEKNDQFPLKDIDHVPQSIYDSQQLALSSYEDCQKLFQDIHKQPSAQADLEFIIDDKTYWYHVFMKNIYDYNDHIINTFGYLENIQEQYEQRKEAEENERIQAKLIADAFITCKINLTQGMVHESNQVTLQEPIPYQTYLRDTIVPYINSDYQNNALSHMTIAYLLQEHKMGRDTVEMTFQMKSDDHYIWVSCIYHILGDYPDQNIYALMMINNIDEQKRKELELKEQSEKDGLTGLYNARTLKTKVNDYLQSIESLYNYHIFILLDLDNFKRINDTFGHMYGDQVLKDVSQILKKKFRNYDIIARLGGDEFVVMLLDVKDKKAIMHTYEKLVSDLRLTYTKDGISITVSASLGISIAPEHGQTFDELYHKADIALYTVKNKNKNGYAIYGTTDTDS